MAISKEEAALYGYITGKTVPKGTTRKVFGTLVSGVIGAGVTVISVLPSVVIMSRNSLNTTSTTLQVGAGTTAFVAYNVREYDKRDIYDEYSDNDEFETEADSIIDFAESNPFGTY